MNKLKVNNHQDPRLKDFTPQEIADRRIKCCEILIPWASRNAVEREEVFKQADKVWQFMLKGLGPDPVKETPNGPGQEASQSSGKQT